MTSERTAIALRVLNAINNRRPVPSEDLAKLRSYFPDQSARGPDELACLAIMRALGARDRGLKKRNN
jgi:hypothetical protein